MQGQEVRNSSKCNESNTIYVREIIRIDCFRHPIMQEVFFWGGGVGRVFTLKKQYKLRTLGSLSCFSELNIHCFNANTRFVLHKLFV